MKCNLWMLVTPVNWRNATSFVMDIRAKHQDCQGSKFSSQQGNLYKKYVHHGTGTPWKKWPMVDILWAGCFIDGSGNAEYPICVELGRDNCTLGMLWALQLRNSIRSICWNNVLCQILLLESSAYYLNTEIDQILSPPANKKHAMSLALGSTFLYTVFGISLTLRQMSAARFQKKFFIVSVLGLLN